MKIRLLSSLASVAALTAMLVPAPANAAGPGRSGALDRSFGTGGKVFARAPKAVAHSEFGAAELEGNGDLVVELRREVVEKEGGVREIERRLPDGTLDPSFGKDGRVRVGFGSGLAIRPDGSILVNTSSCGPKKGSLLLLDASGNRAAEFGENGCGPQLGFGMQYIDVAPSGAVLIGGIAAVCPCSAKSVPMTEPVVAKLQANGAPDPAFGKSGVVHLRADLGVQAEVLQSRSIDGIASTADGGVVVASEKLLIGIGPNGALSTGFGTGGTAEVGALSTALTALPSGKLVVAASLKTYAFQPATAMVVSRFLPNGTLDAAFGSAGRFQLPLPEETEARGLAPAPGERVLMVGETGPGKECRGICHSTMFLTRIGDDGQYDSSYGNRGILDLPRPPSEEYQHSPGISAFSVSAAGAAIVAGGYSANHAYAIAAMPNGALDTGFGEDGMLLDRHFAPPNLETSGLALGPTGAITVAAEGTSGDVEYGGFLIGFRGNGRQTKGASGLGVSPTEARGEIVPVRGGLLSIWDNPPLLAVDQGGRTLGSYGAKGSVEVPKGFKATTLVSGRGGRAFLLGSVNDDAAMAILKLGPKGKPERAFGQNGLAKVSFGGESARAYAATVAPDGSLVVTGFVGGWTGAAKLEPNGRLDRRFGQGGRIRHLIRSGTAGSQIAPLLGGVVIGAYRSGASAKLAELVRLDSRGHLVRSFGRHSVVRAKIEGRFIGLFTHGKRTTVVSDNEYLGNGSGGVELRAYLPSGSPDPAFGDHGLATGAVGQSPYFHPVAAVQQADGKIVVAGAAWNGELGQIELLRFR